MKAERMMCALLLLQTRGQLSSSALSAELEVSERTVHRDMEALSAAGVPVYAMRGAQGGWRLDENWRTEVPGLTEAELRALVMVQPRAAGHPRLAAAAERAYQKLIASLPVTMRQQAAAMRERLHVDPTGWHMTNEDLSMLPLVQEAVAQDRRLRFTYVRVDGEKAQRTVDPLGIVAKGASWYLAARTAKGMRTYRISRMSEIEVSLRSFQRPLRFQLDVYWRNSTAEMQRKRHRFEATLAMTPQAAGSLGTWLELKPVTEAVPGKLAEGWVAMRAGFESMEHARFVVLGFGARMRVLDPETLRSTVEEEAREIVKLAGSTRKRKKR
ncbi:MAG TPA: WYL domain-containing protein [Acidobacteriaceae bacterium]|nr:WYL domain-containing protein [Acidobacteriaceae bacterium]